MANLDLSSITIFLSGKTCESKSVTIAAVLLAVYSVRCFLSAARGCGATLTGVSGKICSGFTRYMRLPAVQSCAGKSRHVLSVPRIMERLKGREIKSLTARVSLPEIITYK